MELFRWSDGGWRSQPESTGDIQLGKAKKKPSGKKASGKAPSVKKTTPTKGRTARLPGYTTILAEVVDLLEEARRAASRSVNTVMTASYWLVGQQIVEKEQSGKARAGYGEALLERLSGDLTRRFGRGFSADRLETMRLFYIAYPPEEISATASRKLGPRKSATVSRNFNLTPLTQRFALSWSHYALLVRRSRSAEARAFYEEEALRSGWTVRQLNRQIGSQFYERTLLSRNKAAMLKKGEVAKSEDRTTPEEEIKDPYVLEFLGLKDEYSESDLEDALISQLEAFLLELGGDFAFIRPPTEAAYRR